MLDFRAKTKSKKLPYGPEVSRWLWILFLLGVVVIVAGPLMQPATWEFIARGFRLGRHGQEPPIDTRLPPKGNQDDSGTIVVVPMDKHLGELGVLAAAFRQEPVLSRQQLEQIQDDALFRRAEQEVWRQLLELLHQREASELEKQSEGLVSYGQLFRQSGAYRGRLITVRGQLRRAERIPMPANAWGQRYYYQTWLQPADHPSNPIQIYCLELPEGFPLGLQIQEEVEITGFYFKRVAYQARDGLRTAPTLVAKTVRWFPRPSLAREEQPLKGPALVLILVAVAGLGIGTAVMLYYRVRPKGEFKVPKVVDFSQWTPSEEPTAAPGAQSLSTPSVADIHQNDQAAEQHEGLA